MDGATDRGGVAGREVGRCARKDDKDLVWSRQVWSPGKVLDEGEDLTRSESRPVLTEVEE